MEQGGGASWHTTSERGVCIGINLLYYQNRIFTSNQQVDLTKGHVGRHEVLNTCMDENNLVSLPVLTYYYYFNFSH